MALNTSRSPYLSSRHQRYQDTPDYKERRYNRRRKKERQSAYHFHRGHKRPTKTERAEFTMEIKQQILLFHGNVCFICHIPRDLTFHHVKFKSKDGRGTYRNGLPLCHTCHDSVHEESPQGTQLAHSLRLYIMEQYGASYYMDKWDLYSLGYISSPTDELFERYMEKQELLAQTKNISLLN